MMVLAETRGGKVEGLEHDGILVFRGIPYAAPPVGRRRWLAPQREEPWHGVRDATRFSPVSAQGSFGMAAMMGAGEPVKSEDSLYLNVFTPACDDARRPVMVWIHGGAYVFGSGDTPWYDGTQFCRHGDVVVVTLNYRLGPFGYLHLADHFGPEFDGSGNAGLLDQIAALEWVRDCITSFGGDPDNVTVFGESAGAGSVGTLLGTPRARGLFRNAIAQSGAASWWSSREHATDVAEQLLGALRVSPGDADALREVSMDDLIAATTKLRVHEVGRLPFQPVVDGTIVPQPPLEAIAAGNAAGVHLLTGTNRHEMTLFTMLDAALAGSDDAHIAARVERLYGPGAARVVADYRARRGPGPAADLWIDVGTDALFRIPAIRLAEVQGAHAPTWMYLFTWESPAFGGVLRSTHALEIPFVFDNLDRGGASMFTGLGGERQQIADAMHTAWIAFARNGDPNRPGAPEWPVYESRRRATMRFDTASELVDDPLGDDRRAWDGFRR